MERLLYIIGYTPDIEASKAFYRDGIGLPTGNESPHWVDFDAGEWPRLGLLAVGKDQPRAIELCFESRRIDDEVADLRARGLEFVGELRDEAFGRLIHFHDPEGNLVSLIQRPGGSNDGSGEGRSQGEAGGGTAVAVAVAPRVSVAIVNCRDLARTKSFYHNLLGLHLTSDQPWWTELECGGTRLALHPHVERAEREEHHSGKISIGFAVDDLITWADEARERGITFASAPEDEGWGLHADVVDPEGYELTFRETPRVKSEEEKLGEDFEDDDPSPTQAPIRKTVAKRAPAISRVVNKPQYKAAGGKKSTRKAAKARPSPRPATATLKQARSARGTGPAGAREKPKRLADPKRARTRPATGRLKKAERKTAASKKVAVASASKARPVKRASARKVVKKR